MVWRLNMAQGRWLTGANPSTSTFEIRRVSLDGMSASRHPDVPSVG